MTAKLIVKDEDGYEGVVVAVTTFGRRIVFMTTDRMYDGYLDGLAHLSGVRFGRRNLPDRERFEVKDPPYPSGPGDPPYGENNRG